MLFNHTRIIVRQLQRNGAFTAINFAGLISGIVVCLLVTQFVWFESSFEQFNANGHRTYRVNLYNTSNGVFESISSGTVSGLAHAMNQTLPSIETIGRLSSKVKGIVTNRRQNIENLEGEMVYADPSIIHLLGVDMIKGDQRSLLKNPQTIAISESTALKYFGQTDVVGKVLEIGFTGSTIEMKPHQIHGVFKDIPPNTHQRFDIILAPENTQAWNENWAWSNVSKYVILQAGVEPESITGGLAEIVKQHHQDNTGDRYLLEPITEIRLHALDGSGRAPMVTFFVILGGVIILLAWFNFIGLSTARFLERMKEVGVRKLVGASRKQLIAQLLLESFFFNSISFLAALLLFIVVSPIASHYLNLPTSQTFLSEPQSWVIIFVSVIAGTIFSGIYPSLFISSFKPLESLKGRVNELADRSTLRKVLVVVQLAISLVLITAVFAIDKQIRFMQDQKLGISLDQTLIIEEPLLTDNSSINKFEPFKNELLRLSSVHGVTYASSFPGSEIDWHRTDITLGAENAGYRFDSRIISIGTEFLDLFGLSLLNGRNFDPGIAGDSRAMLINDEARKMFGFKNNSEALNKLVFIGSRKFEIIGIVNNYHYRSLQYPMQPLLYIQGYPRNPSYAIKIKKDNIPETILTIEARWKEAYTGNIFRYHFLDEEFGKQYASDKQIGTIVAGLTILAIVISFLGLFGLSLYSVNRRTREIAIRKVLGASTTGIIALLSRDFLKLSVIGGMIGVLVVQQGLQVWLQRYAYQMPLDFWLFALPFALVTVLTVVAVSFKTFRAANTNPTENIRYE